MVLSASCIEALGLSAGTVFTDQGRPNLDDTLVNSTTDFEFALWDAETIGGGCSNQAGDADGLAIPIETWDYHTQDATIRYIGPTAQGFYAAFSVGEDDKHITTIDADGVAFAAILRFVRDRTGEER